ncbi:MAG TPA: VacB/RNase II family 3'-5' exoribonuclease [Spirochaetota bacterium]|nr:VacB/RNase II family 3'-5' exoribonuclease [Spirochaetota bacterium]HPQ52409.1 VacB/RNase II family 3'-5' exoribonuclease [Spirochaetota bacterium]
MAISSKRIIQFISSLNDTFTFGTIRKQFEKKSKKRKRNHTGSKDIQKIEHVLNTLVALQYLKKNKKSYSKNRDFHLTGTIIIKPSGDGIVQLPDSTEVAIPAQATNNAHHKDIVRIGITNIRQNYIMGRVISVLQHSRSEYSAKIEYVYDDIIYLQLVDLPGRVKVYALSSPGQPRAGYLARVTLGKNRVDGRQECTISSMYPSTSEEFDVQRIIVKHDLPAPYNPEKYKYEDLKDSMSHNIENRKDYRHLYTITIDGEYAKDFDDAISLEKTGAGYTLYVHIADVSHFVKKGGDLDNEAYTRGTSYYLGNTVIPMLPEVLSNNLCSLVEGEDRLTLTAEINIDQHGVVSGSTFYKGIIQSNKRLTYTGAYEIIKNADGSPLSLLLIEMDELAKKIKSNRMKRGRVDLDLPDQEIIYDGDSTVDIHFATRLPSHEIIEEFMLTANEAASKTLRENNVPSLYRVHENISPDKLYSLKWFLRSLNITLRESDNIGTSLQEVIDSVSGREYEQVVNFIILKSFMQAFYGEKPLGHFGLGFKDYTHFTSPIRRYPDLIVHRCITAMIEGGKQAYRDKELHVIGEQSSALERIAQNAERDLVKLKSCRLMMDHTGEIFDVVISGISKSGLFVSLLEKPIEGFIPLRLLTDDYYVVNEDEYTIIGKKLGRRFRLGDRIKAKLFSVEIDTMRIDFDVA